MKSLQVQKTVKTGNFELISTVPTSITEFSKFSKTLIQETNEIFSVDGNSIYLDTVKQGEFNSEIRAYQWSPDQEILVIVEENVLLLNNELQVLAEFDLLDNNQVGFVNVGWGSVDTQFKGSIGKNGTASTTEVTEKTEVTDTTITVHWRDDGNYFCISHPYQLKRMLKIYDRNGQLQHASEPTDVLPIVDWRPNGLITTVNKKVLFYEKNGLPHGEFEIPQGKVSDLKWNFDGSLLAIVIDDTITIWSSLNYHWYLMQSIPVVVNSMQWDLEDANVLHVISEEYIRFEFKKMFKEQGGIVGVVDGNSVRLTPFGKVMTPPPMSHSEIKFDDPVVAISINKSMAVLTCKSIELVSNIDLKSKDLVKVTIGSFENGRLIEMINDKEFLVVEFRNGSDVLVHVCLDQNGTLTRNDIHIEDDLFESMIGFPKPAIQTKSGTVYELRKVDGSFLPIQKTTFPTVCQVFQACEMMFANHSETVYVGLDKRNKCYLNHHLLASNVTSIYVQSEFLLMTNLEHQCLFIPLHQLVESLDQVEPGQGVERSRRIEQGAQIVTVAGMNVVLIMPRGNIETIAPRPLVLSYIRKCIDQKEYRNAFIACRKHRVDLNYLIDVDLETFLTNVHVFVEQVDVDDWLNLVIGGLKDDSTAEFKTASKVLTRSGEQQVNEDRLGSGVKRYMKQKESSAKTNRVCEAMRTVLPPSRVQPILTTFAKQVPPKLEDALRCITLMNKELQKDALTYLIFLVDVETLYKTALGMYDFPVALMVAQQSKMDPREYLPYLQSLNVLPESEKKYQVDHDLDRFDNAVGHLVKYSSVEGVMVYVKEHQLYNVAMDLYEFGTDGYIKLANLCGEWMVDEQEYRNAGAVFEQIGNMERAIDVYTLGLFWKEAMRLASLVGRIDDVKKVLVEGLVESKRWSEAAQVCDLGGDVKGAISMYALARDYDSALYLCAKHQSSPTETLSNLKSYSETIVTNLTNKNQVFIKEFEQLQKIRMEKLTGTFVIRQAVEDIEMLDDTASMATTRVTGRTFLTSRTGVTGMTGATNQTGKTARQRRKQAKKREQGRNPWFADEYLMASLKSQIIEFNTGIESMAALIRVLVGFRNEAKAVQSKIKEYESTIKERQGDVFECQPLVGTHYLVQLSNLGLDVDISAKEGEVAQEKVIEGVSLDTTNWSII